MQKEDDMALTKGMLDKFRKLVSDKDEPLLKVRLSTRNDIYGYLREVGSDFFTIDEVKSVRTSLPSSKWLEMRYSVKNNKVGLTTLTLDDIESWTELTPNTVVP